MDTRRVRPRARRAAALITLRLRGETAEVGPLLEVGGEIRTLPDPMARVAVSRSGLSLQAQWPDGLVATVRARRLDNGHRVDCSVSNERRAVVVGAVGLRILGLSATRMLVDGYHSWDWAGVRDAGAGYGWWGGVWGTPGGAQTSVALDAPPRLGPLLLRWNHGRSVGAMSVGAPPQLSQATGAPPSLGTQVAAGETLHGDPVRIAPLDRRSSAGVGLPRLQARDRRPAPRTVGWMSWNCLGPAATAADVVDACASLVPPGGLALLDDGWMAHWGDWREREDFDATIADLAAAVHATGRRFGLWLAPFLVDPRSRSATENDALLLRDTSGERIVSTRAPHEQFVLDASRGATRAHLSALGRRMGRLGVDALKLDFLFAGALGGDIAALRAGVAAVVRGYRAAAPRDALVLACGAPAAALVGLVDTCRSGDDSVANIPAAGVPEAPPHPWFTHGELLLRAQQRNLAARAWLWGSTVPPDADAFSLALVGDTPAPDDATARRWLDLARRAGGPLLDADSPDGRVTTARLRMLRRAQSEVMGRSPRPVRPREPLSGSAVADDAVGFHDWPEELPA